MSQKIYTDRTELEGVDLPSAGQTRMLVIDENKKIKSEAKPTIPTKTSDLTNDGDGVSPFITEADLPPSELQDLQSVMEQGSSATFVNPTEPLPEQVGFLFLGENGGFSNIYNRSGSNHSSGLSTSVNVDNGDNVGYVSGGTNFAALSNSFTSNISTRLNASIDGNDFGGELVIGTSDSGGASLRNEIFVSGDRTGFRINSNSNVGIVIIDEIGEFGLSYASDYSENGEANDLWIPSWGAVKAYAAADETVIPTFFIDVVLDKNDINNLHATPITITNTMLGLESGQGAKFLKEQLETTIFIDGTPFSSTRPIQIGNGEIDDIMSLHDSTYTAPLPDGTYAGGGMTSFLTYKVKDEYYIIVKDEITGGGAGCHIKFRIFYQKIDI